MDYSPGAWCKGVAQLLNSFLRLTVGTTFCCENLQRQAKWTPKCCALGRCSPQPSLTLLVTRCARYFTRCLSDGNYKLQASSTACLRTAIERCCRCSVPGSAFTAGSPGRRHSVRHFLPVRRQRTLFCERFARAALLCRCRDQGGDMCFHCCQSRLKRPCPLTNILGCYLPSARFASTIYWALESCGFTAGTCSALT